MTRFALRLRRRHALRRFGACVLLVGLALVGRDSVPPPQRPAGPVPPPAGSPAAWAALAIPAAAPRLRPVFASLGPHLPAPAPSTAPRPPLRIASADHLAALFADLDYRLDELRRGQADVPRVFLASMPQDLEALPEVAMRKRIFFQATLPLVLAANEAILGDRQRLDRLAAREVAGIAPGAAERAWLERLAARYGTAPDALEALRARVDIVPPSLALAQAAIESGWGTSRFAREGRALFGQRIYVGADGMVPASPGGGQPFRVRSFGHLGDAVRSYIHNLNTHWAYAEFRRRRAELRAGGKALDGWTLAATLARYSERGEAYVRDLRRTIRANRLDPFDGARLLDGDTIRIGAAGGI